MRVTNLLFSAVKCLQLQLCPWTPLRALHPDPHIGSLSRARQFLAFRFFFLQETNPGFRHVKDWTWLQHWQSAAVHNTIVSSLRTNFRDKLIVQGVRQVFFHYSINFIGICNLELYQISWSTSISSGCCIDVARAWPGARSRPPDQTFQSPVWASSSASGVKPLQPTRQIEHWTREHRETRDASALCNPCRLTHG